MRLTFLLLLLIFQITIILVTSQESYKFIAYYTNWAQYRRCAGYEFFPENIEPIAWQLTHIHYAFAKFDEAGNVIPIEWNDCTIGEWPGCQGQSDTMFKRMMAIKDKYSHLKVLISLGGWSWGPIDACPIFSAMAASPEARAKFVNQSVSFARVFKFDGIDVDWEYPAALDRGCKKEDTQNFEYLISELRSEIDKEAQKSGKTKLLLSISSPAAPDVIEDVKPENLEQYLDYLNLMCYDYHG
eukprot:TRINITY_DN2493_c0_g1_i4.p1 TRINITY_DN2493_c0_g1~~TRINITY_DN2493_c0_g1_i4.p1  ORF type:complete len:242 (+),score=26.84 TRINITY_DN2493_c0_g1_i4:27-752(+)